MAVIGTDISIASKELKQGNLVGIPTETVYGLAANAFDETAVTKIFEVKKRPSFDPLIVHIPGYAYLETVASEIPEIAKKMVEHFWPGPLTLVLPKTNVIPDLVTSGLSTVAVRVPNHPMTLELLGQLDFPLASPSANPFGYISPTSAQHVAEQLGDSIPYILDGGNCKVGIESTIVGFDQGQAVIYRPGGVSEEDLKEITGVLGSKPSAQVTLAPGMLKSHYAPSKKMIIGEIAGLISKYGAKKIAILSFKNSFNEIRRDHQIQLSPKGSLREAAQNLFGSLRKLDAMDIRYIFAELVPEQGLGIAINDRLRRAASK
jgi:L-threonylcarbamoyladenylate synthase